MRGRTHRRRPRPGTSSTEAAGEAIDPRTAGRWNDGAGGRKDAWNGLRRAAAGGRRGHIGGPALLRGGVPRLRASGLSPARNDGEHHLHRRNMNADTHEARSIHGLRTPARSGSCSQLCLCVVRLRVEPRSARHNEQVREQDENTAVWRTGAGPGGRVGLLADLVGPSDRRPGVARRDDDRRDDAGLVGLLGTAPRSATTPGGDPPRDGRHRQSGDHVPPSPG